MSTIYLIRHGLTQANLQHLYCGSTDLPLDSVGIKQLQQLHYNMEFPCRFVTSGMQRTEQTLELLFGPQPHLQEPRLREMDFGVFEMRSYAMLKDDSAYQAWLKGDNEANMAPGGESGRQMCCRVLEAYQDLKALGNNLVIVTHGGPIAAILEFLFPEEGKNRYQWQCAPGHGYAITGHSYRQIP